LQKVGAARRAARYRATRRGASTIRFARLASGAFYEAIGLAAFYEIIIIDGLVKSLERPNSVIPAKAGIQSFQGVLDPGFRRGDGLFDFLRDHHYCKYQTAK
jgi:hypothetical protein